MESEYKNRPQDMGIGQAMIEMLRIYSNGFLENVTIEKLPP